MSKSTPTPAAHQLGLVGRKVGMTRIFTEDGESIPVTVLDVSNNRVTQVKSLESDGYAAIQVAYGTRRASRVFFLKLKATGNTEVFYARQIRALINRG